MIHLSDDDAVRPAPAHFSRDITDTFAGADAPSTTLSWATSSGVWSAASTSSIRVWVLGDSSTPFFEKLGGTDDNTAPGGFDADALFGIDLDSFDRFRARPWALAASRIAGGRSVGRCVARQSPPT